MINEKNVFLQEAVVWEPDTIPSRQNEQTVSLSFPKGKTYEDVAYYEVFGILVKSSSENDYVCFTGKSLDNKSMARVSEVSPYDKNTKANLALIYRYVSFNENTALIRVAYEDRQGQAETTHPEYMIIAKIVAHFK